MCTSMKSPHLLALQVVQVPPAYLYAHHQLLDEFRNATHWPKHLLIQYSFALAPTVDALAGLYVVFILCAASCLCVHVMLCVHHQLHPGHLHIGCWARCAWLMTFASTGPALGLAHAACNIW